jgi:mono/diheme cytochrome c family protein
MKHVIVMIGLLAAMLMVTTAFAAGNAAAGKEVYEKKCASCHGAAGEGKDTVAKMLKVELRPLGSKDVQAKSDADLKKAIVEGTGKMKAVTGIDAKAADDVIAFVRTLKK